MADGDGFIGQFLKNTTSLKGVSFAGATGVNWIRVASGVVGSFLVAWYTGLIGVIQTATSRYAALIDGYEAFLVGPFVIDSGTPGDASSIESLPGLLFAAVNLATSALEGAFIADFSEYGILGYLVGLTSILAAAWVLSQTATWVTTRYL